MKAELYIIHCKSNLHVGSGDSNYGVIDKLVQRDTADNLPCIFSSSLKGAFREYFEEVIEKAKPVGKKVLSYLIFGEGANKNSNSISKGSHVFQQAFLLSIPFRSNQKPFFSAISPFMVEQVLEMANLLNYKFPGDLEKELQTIKGLKPKNNKPIILSSQNGLEIEDFSDFDPINQQFPELQKIIDNDLVIVSTDDMKLMTDDYHLPIIARNKLENGQSKNLWYEQVIPRESTFYTFVATDSLDDKFHTKVNNKMVQIGGDSSVGYGYCIVHTLPKTTKP